LGDSSKGVTQMSLVEILMVLSMMRVPEHQEPRVQVVVQDIVQVSTANPVFDGERASIATAVALWAIADHEGGMQQKYQDCSGCRKGTSDCDSGRSITLFALMTGFAWGNHSRLELCSNNRLATERASVVLGYYRKAGSTLGMFEGYASGSVGIHSKAACELEATFRRGLRKVAVNVRFINGRLVAE
jgi:hypothetical protein